MEQSPSSPHLVSTITRLIRFATELELSRSPAIDLDITKAADMFSSVCVDAAYIHNSINSS